MKIDYRRMLESIIVIALYFAVILIIGSIYGCKSAHYETARITQKDSVYQSVMRYDSARWERIIHDSVYIYKNDYRDTLIKDSTYVLEKADGTREVYRDRLQRIIISNNDSSSHTNISSIERERMQSTIDSLLQAKQDSVPYPVEKQLTAFQKGWMQLGKIFAGIMLIFVITLFVYCFYKIKK